MNCDVRVAVHVVEILNSLLALVTAAYKVILKSSLIYSSNYMVLKAITD